MYRIAIDLELEQPKTKAQTSDSKLDVEKIIQVGWVVFNDENGEIVKSVVKNINIGVPLSSFIKSLTGISDEDISNGTDLISIINELHADREAYQCSRKLITWGAGDQEAILKELPKDYKWGFGRSSFNVKHLFQLWAEVNGITPGGGLKKSMNKLGLKFKGSAHNALVDAENTATVFLELSRKLKIISK